MKIISALYLLTINIAIYSTPPLDYLPLAKSQFIKWDADSLFIGASAVVLSDTTPVIVKWKATYVQCLGKLYFLSPGEDYSPRLLFHNMIDSFPGEKKEINLGKFPKNTELYFMYTVVDTNKQYEMFRDKKLYSGPNRDSIDTYVSDLRYAYGWKWAVAGKIDNTRIEIGFSDNLSTRFCAIIFQVSGVKIKRYLPTTPVNTSNPNANQKTKDLLQYLYSISGKMILSGQESMWSHGSFPSSCDQHVYTQTGKYPAVYASDFGDVGTGNLSDRQKVVSNAIAYAKKGSIISIQYHMIQPDLADGAGFEAMNISGSGYTKMDQILTENSDLNIIFKERLDELAGFLKTLQDSGITVLFRPYHEMNGDWFW